MESITEIRCVECGKAFGPDDMEYTSLRGKVICLACFEDMTEDEE